MFRMAKLVALFSSLVLLLAVCSFAADSSNSKNSTTKTPAKVTTKSPAKTTANLSAQPDHVLASAEDLTGTISSIDPSGKELTVVGSNGVPYDFRLTKKTEIEHSSQKLAVNELANESHKQATVHFVPTSQGNMAKTIQITS